MRSVTGSCSTGSERSSSGTALGPRFDSGWPVLHVIPLPPDVPRLYLHCKNHLVKPKHQNLSPSCFLLFLFFLSRVFQNGTLHFCGFQVLAPQIFWSPAHCPPAARAAMLEGWGARLKGLPAEKPLTFAPCELFDLSFQGGFLLWPGVREERESRPYGITTGHHLGKPLPPDNQTKAQPADENKPDCRN